MRRARALDSPALTEIYDTHNEGLYYYALRLCGDESLAEDGVTEVFSRVRRAFATLIDEQQRVIALKFVAG